MLWDRALRRDEASAFETRIVPYVSLLEPAKACARKGRSICDAEALAVTFGTLSPSVGGEAGEEEAPQRDLVELARTRILERKRIVAALPAESDGKLARLAPSGVPPAAEGAGAVVVFDEEMDEDAAWPEATASDVDDVDGASVEDEPWCDAPASADVAKDERGLTVTIVSVESSI